MAFGAANLIRQAVIVAIRTEIPRAIRIASWVITALLVFGIITGVAVLRRGRAPRPEPVEAASGTPARPRPADDRRRGQAASTSSRWAPWWVYFVVIVGANSLRRAVLADGSTPAARVAMALAFSAALFLAITLIHRIRGSPVPSDVFELIRGAVWKGAT